MLRWVDNWLDRQGLEREGIYHPWVRRLWRTKVSCVKIAHQSPSTDSYFLPKILCVNVWPGWCFVACLLSIRKIYQIFMSGQKIFTSSRILRVIQASGKGKYDLPGCLAHPSGRRNRNALPDFSLGNSPPSISTRQRCTSCKSRRGQCQVTNHHRQSPNSGGGQDPSPSARGRCHRQRQT